MSSVGDFSLDVRVYYEDTDASGIVYHANYVRFLERARTEWLRQLQFDQSDLLRDEQIVFVVADMNLRFLKPARLDDVLTIGVNLSRCGGASMTFEQTVSRGSDAELLVSAAVRVGCVDATDLRPTRIPPSLYKELTE